MHPQCTPYPQLCHSSLPRSAPKLFSFFFHLLLVLESNTAEMGLQGRGTGRRMLCHFRAQCRRKPCLFFSSSFLLLFSWLPPLTLLLPFAPLVPLFLPFFLLLFPPLSSPLSPSSSSSSLFSNCFACLVFVSFRSLQNHVDHLIFIILICYSIHFACYIIIKI